jgi:hypothetical protein
MKADIEGLRPGEPMIVDEQGRLISVVLRIIPETPEEVSQLKRFCRTTDAFTFVIDEDFRNNTAHIAPVYAERAFSVLQRPMTVEELLGSA